MLSNILLSLFFATTITTNVSGFPISIYTIENFTSSTIPELNTNYNTTVLPQANDTTVLPQANDTTVLPQANDTISNISLLGGCISTTYGCCGHTQIQCIDTQCSNCVLDNDTSLLGGCLGTEFGCCTNTQIQCIDTQCSNCVLYLEE